MGGTQRSVITTTTFNTEDIRNVTKHMEMTTGRVLKDKLPLKHGYIMSFSL